MTHAEAPGAGWNSPERQVLQAVEPVEACDVPAAHGAHAVCPERFWKVPAGQRTQAVALGYGWCWPGGQRGQALAITPLNPPGGQERQVDWLSSGWKSPALHVEHAVLPVLS